MGWSNAGWRSDQGGWYKNAVASGTTLDPAFVSPNASLSNGFLTVSSTGATNNTEKSLGNHSSGNYYCEFTIGQASNTIYGVCDGTQISTNYIGQTGNAFGWLGSWLGGSGAASGPALVVGHVYGMAVTISAGVVNLWLKDITAAGNWNNGVSADPFTGVGGRVASLVGAVYVAITCSANGDSTTYNFGGSAYTGAPPSGFGNW